MKTSRSLFDESKGKKSLDAERVFEAEMAVRRRTMIKVCVPAGILLVLAVIWIIMWQYSLARKPRSKSSRTEQTAIAKTVSELREAGYEAAPLKLRLFTDENPPQELASLLIEAADRRPSTIRVEMRNFTSLPDGDPLRENAGQQKIVLRATSSMEAHSWEKTMELGRDGANDLAGQINEWHLELFPDRGVVFSEAARVN